ncbi:MAG: hypothetical protein LAQ30_25145, partial [Acidobacteriia bacterium]|nr:hypothetical protein [Terriglobia bacterium]
PKLRERYTNEDAIAQMQKDVKIIPIDVDNTGERHFATAFMVKFSYADKYKAQSVVQELVTKFINQNTIVQRNSADQTKGFLSDEKKNAKDRLDRLQDDIAKFRADNQGRLPEEANYNLNRLQSLYMQLSQANERLSRSQQSKNILETNLQNRLAFQNLLSQPGEIDAPAQQVKNQMLVNLDNQINQMEGSLAAAREMYTESYPAVRELKAQIEVLKKRKTEEQTKQEQELAAAAAAPASQPRKGLTPQQQTNLELVKNEIEVIKTQIRNADQEIKNITTEKSGIDRQIQEVSGRIEAEPLVDQRWQEFTRDLGAAKEHYEDLVKREQSAETAKNLEDRGAGETLEVLDPASLPQSPSDPNRWMIAGMGTGIGLLIGLVLAGAKEAKDTSLKNLKDVRAYTNLPVLSSIPLLENALLVRRKRRLFWLGWSTAVIIGAAAMTASMYYYYSPKGQ